MIAVDLRSETARTCAELSQWSARLDRVLEQLRGEIDRRGGGQGEERGGDGDDPRQSPG